jgi:hypothetical protein
MHVYNEERVPICRFYQQHGHCQKEDLCLYKHPEPKELIEKNQFEGA